MISAIGRRRTNRDEFTPLERKPGCIRLKLFEGFPTSFTLIEILVVVLLLGILLGIATPRIASSFPGMQLSTASKNITALARYAGQRAVLDEICYRINFDKTDGKYWLIYQKEPLADPENFQHFPGSLGRIYNLPEKVKIIRVTHPADSFPYITFYPDGTMDETKIYLKNSKGKVYTLSTSQLVGKIIVEEINAR